MATLEITENCTERTRGYTGKRLETRNMADHEEALYSGRRDDSPIDHDARNEREGSRESDHDDRDQRRRGGGYERDLRRESRRFAPYPSQDERSSSRGQSGSGGKECRVYVWNLPYQVRWQDLKDYMKKGIVTFLLFTPFEGFLLCRKAWLQRIKISKKQQETTVYAVYTIYKLLLQLAL